jgi:hypothetical protein
VRSRARARAALAEWLLFDSQRRLPPLRLCLYTFFVMLLAIAAERDMFTRNMPFTTDGHAILSLEVALNTPRRTRRIGQRASCRETHGRVTSRCAR